MEEKREEKQVTLNGNQTTLREIEERKKDQSVRIVEKGEGTGDFRELKKLKE
jgi:hypothetical protein